MTIIISKNGKNAKPVPESTFEREGNLQKYIYDNPESIRVYDIKKDIQLLILAREFYTEHGPIDALGIDKDGEVYLIETKLYRNSDKRSIVAQVLEKFKQNTVQLVKEFFGIEDEDAALLLENVRQNLSKGNYRFVVLLDKVDDQLKNLILFINENIRFDLFAVEFEYYKHEDYEILIPKLYCAEVKKDIAGGYRPNKQNDDFFRQKIKEVKDKELSNAILDLYEFGRTELAEPG